jgi:hypothetical protein
MLNALFSGARVYARWRWPVLSFSLALGSIVYASTGGVARDEREIAGLLGEASGTMVDPSDYVWLDGGGRVLDALWGRSVVFLGRGDGPRDIYRANVTVTPSGKALDVRFVRSLRETPSGDEHSLVTDGKRLAVATSFNGQTVAVTRFDVKAIAALPLGADPVKTVISVAGDGPVAFGFDANGLVVRTSFASGVWDDGGHLIRSTGDADEELFASSTNAVLHGVDGRAAVVLSDRPTAPRALPPEGALAVADDPALPPAVFRQSISVGGRPGTLLSIDGSLAEFDLAFGQHVPESRSGYVPSGRVDTSQMIAGLFSLPVALDASNRGRCVTCAASSEPVLFINKDGARGIGLSGAPAARDSLTLGLSKERVTALAALAVDVNGNASLAFVEMDDVAALQSYLAQSGLSPSMIFDASDAVVAFNEGSGRMVGLRGDEVSPCVRDCAKPSVILRRREPHHWPIRAPGGSEWTQVEGAEAAYQSTVTMFDSEVRVYRFDEGRYGWSLLAGTKEKKHRFDGAFPTQWTQSTLPFVAMPLGVGKRRGPRGLRIDGSTGLKFGAGGGILAIGPTRALTFVAPGTDLEDLPSAVELPITAQDGELTPLARERGPLQSRGDVCVLPGGTLVAVGEYDSHEAPAQVLLSLGCDTVVALDRGSEPPTEIQFGAAVALPSEGSVLLGTPAPRRSNMVVR